MFKFLKFITNSWFFEANADGGSGSGAQGDQEDGAEDKSKEKEDKSKAGEKKDEKTFTQAELNAILNDRLERERKKNESAAEKAKKDAEAAALEKNQEWQKLAESRAGEIAALTQQVEKLTSESELGNKYKAILDKQLEEVKKKLPKVILPLIEKMSTEDAMNYINEHAEELGAFKPGTFSETPDGKEKKNVSKEDEQAGQRSNRMVISQVF